MNAVLDNSLFLPNCGINVVPKEGDLIQLKNIRNKSAVPFDIKIKDWRIFTNRVKNRTFRRIVSKPGVTRTVKYNIYIILTYHGWIEFKCKSSTLTYHMSQERYREFLNDIKDGKFDLN